MDRLLIGNRIRHHREEKRTNAGQAGRTCGNFRKNRI